MNDSNLNPKKTLDLLQAFDRLHEKVQEFNKSATVEGMTRNEIERLIQQVNRLYDNLEKYMNIVSSGYGY